ncbi:MAG: PQQ-binding-like beta-propeller repeat protein [Planctomycetes bacterium]|nr:PQQ-binding-like beta-propeller repeat protein [Planctomycetota bacterium]
MKPAITLAAIAALCMVSLLQLEAAEPATAEAEWPQWHGPDRDLISEESGWTVDWPASGPKELWRVKVGIGFSSCSIAGGRVYTMGNMPEEGQETDIVWCLDAATGKEIWRHAYPCRTGSYKGPRMTPTVDGDVVYTLSREGQLYCLGAADGKVKWFVDVAKEHGVKQTRFKWGFACSPLVLGERLILDLGKTLALEKTTGKLIWSSGDDEAGYSSPTTSRIGGETYINSFNATGLVLVNAKDGKELARHPWGSRSSYFINAASPIFHEGKIFISSGYRTGCALLEASPSGLKLVYKNTDMSNHCNSCVLYKGHLYGFDGQQGSRGSLTCMEFATGEVKWEEKGLNIGSLMIAGGRIVAMLDKGELLVAQATTDGYKELARASVLSGQCWTVPVLVGGRVYCRSNAEGELVCLDVSGK